MDSDEELWDQRSDFFKLKQTGYRTSILGDFEEAEAGGRLMGFHQACKSGINNTQSLSRLYGVLTACLLKVRKKLSEDDVKEICALQKDIAKMLPLIYNPPSEFIRTSKFHNEGSESSDISCREATDSDCVNGCDGECKVASSEETVSQYQNILERTKSICERTGWNIPDFDCGEVL